MAIALKADHFRTRQRKSGTMAGLASRSWGFMSDWLVVLATRRRPSLPAHYIEHRAPTSSSSSTRPCRRHHDGHTRPLKSPERAGRSEVWSRDEVRGSKIRCGPASGHFVTLEPKHDGYRLMVRRDADRFGKSNTVLDLTPTALYELAAPSTPPEVWADASRL